MAQVEAKLVQVGASWGQVGAKLGQVGSKSGPSWTKMAPSWMDHMQHEGYIKNIQKLMKIIIFYMFSEGSGPQEEAKMEPERPEIGPS